MGIKERKRRRDENVFSAIKNVRSLTVLLSVIVVLLVTWALVLPARTITKNAAQKQGGIDVASEAGTLAYEGDGFTLKVQVKNPDSLSENAEITAEEITEETNPEEFEYYYGYALEAVGNAAGPDAVSDFAFAGFYQFVLNADDEAALPDKFKATIKYDQAVKVKNAGQVRVLRFSLDENTGERIAEVLAPSAVKAKVRKGKMRKVTFDADRVSVYAVVCDGYEAAADEAKPETHEVLKDAEAAKTAEANPAAAGDKQYKGDGFGLKAIYDRKAGIPENADLFVREIGKKNKKEYQKYYDEALRAIKADDSAGNVSELSFAKFYDITFSADGKEIEPDGTVQVTISYDEALKAKDADHVRIVHFKEKKNGKIAAEVLDSSDVRTSVRSGKMNKTAFRADSFSVYAVVYTVDFSYSVDGKKYQFSLPGGGFVSLQQLVEALGIAGSDTNYAQFVADVANVEFSDSDLVWVGKAEQDSTIGGLKEANSLECEYSAELTKEQIEDINNSTIEAGDWALISMQPFESEETLTVTMKNGDQFVVKVTDAQDPLGLDGRSFAIVNQRYSTAQNDTSGNGNWYALSTIVSNGQQYGWTGNYIYSYDVTSSYHNDTASGHEYCGDNATAWKFEYNADKDAYYVSADGKYLYIDPNISDKTQSSANSLSLVTDKNTADNGTLIKITRDGNGNYRFSGYNDDSLTLWDYGKQNTNNGMFWLDKGDSDPNGNMRLCLPEDPNGSHKASLVAAKDLSIGQSVVIYQKVWNSNTDSYDFYAIDGNGELQKVWESSDSLYWKEDISIEWELREELGEDGKPTGYLQLYNKKTSKYLAPKSDGSGYSVVHAAASLTEADMKKIRVSLPGRDAGEYSSRIATWDYDDNTTYGLNLHYNPTNQTKPYTLEVKELLQSGDFLFAVRDPLVQKQLTTVDTVDSLKKGIKITMYDFNSTANNNGREPSGNEQRLDYMSQMIGIPNWGPGVYVPGIMSRTLTNGYPVSTWTGQSLNEVFNPSSGGQFGYYIARKQENVSNLFLQSVYDSTGYYYYSGFDNFAYLPEGSSDFKVYEQIGTPFDSVAHAGNNGKDNFFYQRGNFMPFNDLDPAHFRQNVYVGDQNEVPLNDAYPRKNEDLYVVKGTRDYFFGMIMEAKFQQGPNGLSDQGDPMIFEFNGDDDLWVYTDGVLLLDLGGVHDAFHGKVNFQTGVITVDIQDTDGNHGMNGMVNGINYKPTGEAVTYVKEQYWQAHVFPDGSSWTDRNDPKQHQFFTNGGEDAGNLNAQGQPKLKGTFLDYSTHDLKMFYMERGAGASNLEIQFNLPVITGDEFRVTKRMMTTVTGEPIQNAYADAAFYYQAYIKKNGNWVLYSKNDFPAGTTAVYDDDNDTPVVWKENSDTIFEVKPGQTAIIPVADSSVEYKVVEVEPEPGTSHMLDNFNVSNSDEDPDDSKSTTGKTVKRRGQVFFDNKPVDEIVNELRITKKLHGDLYTDNSTASGYVEDQNGSPYFEYRIFLEATSGELVPYSLGEYYQIDGQNGKYVYYDKGQRCYAEVTDDGKYVYTYPKSGKPTEIVDKPKITEHTSANGSLGDVRPGDTIIVKGLLEGTDFVVDERLDRTHMRQKTDEGWEENWDKKYYFSHTDVDGAMERDGSGQPTADTKPNNYEIAGHVYDRPTNYDQLPVSGNEARGTIVTNDEAEVVVHNEVYNKFELPLEKKWSGDFDQIQLDSDAKVTFTLKRYKLEERSGSFTLKANVTDAPAGFDPAYIFTNTESGAVYTVKYSDMTTDGDGRSKTFNLPVGTYTVAHGDDPAGYTGTHSQTSDTVTVTSNDEQDSGGAATPSEITVTSSYIRQSGNLVVTKTLAGYHGNSSFEKFKATYSVTDTAGRAVKDINGNDVGAVTLTYSDFSNNSKTITFSNLPSGQYIVKESIDSSSYDNSKYTVVNTSSNESGLVTVASGTPAQVTYTSTYTEVKSNPVRVYVHETKYGRNDTLYDDSQSFRPGDKIVVTFVHQNNNPEIQYRVNNGQWISVPTTGNGGNAIEEIRTTVPENGVNIEIQDGWSQLKAEHVSVIKEQTRLMSASSVRSVRLAAAAETMQLRGSAYPGNMRSASPIHVDNTAQLPDAPEGKHYHPDSWQLVVTMKNGGDLLNADGQKIGTFTVNNGKWDVVLKGKDFDGLTGTDPDGNRYYYYIDSLGETSVPEGTTPAIETDTVNSEEYKRLYSEEDANTDKKLSAVNELILANKTLTVFKVSKGTTTPLPGAKFTLTLVDENGNNIPAPNNYTSGEVEVPSSGYINFEGLRPGRYKLEETELPAGYVSAEGPYYITISRDGSTELDTSVPHELITPVDGTTDQYKIENTPGAALPHTGGTGTSLNYLLGALLILGGGIMLMARRRREALR